MTDTLSYAHSLAAKTVELEMSRNKVWVLVGLLMPEEASPHHRSIWPW